VLKNLFDFVTILAAPEEADIGATPQHWEKWAPRERSPENPERLLSEAGTEHDAGVILKTVIY
jgi:hypothetical protein